MVCNKDCFNCQLPDCIVDESSIDETKQQMLIDHEIKRNPNHVHQRAIARKFRANNKDKISQWNKEYYQQNKTKAHEAVSQWQKDNREYINAYMRERRARLKAERQAG